MYRENKKSDEKFANNSVVAGDSADGGQDGKIRTTDDR
jgi:hypothetical protein